MSSEFGQRMAESITESADNLEKLYHLTNSIGELSKSWNTLLMEATQEHLRRDIVEKPEWVEAVIELCNSKDERVVGFLNAIGKVFLTREEVS